MEITSSLIQFSDHIAICQVNVHHPGGQVSLYATALAAESDRYADLAQERALALVQQHVTPDRTLEPSELPRVDITQVRPAPVDLPRMSEEPPDNAAPIDAAAAVPAPANEASVPALPIVRAAETDSSNIPW